MLTLTTNAPRLVITSLAFATFLTLSASAWAGAGHGPAKGEPQNQGHMMGAQGGDSHGPAGHHGMEIGAPGKAADVTRTIDVAMHEVITTTLNKPPLSRETQSASRSPTKASSYTNSASALRLCTKPTRRK